MTPVPPLVPSSPTRRRISAGERRSQLIAVALDRFAEQGYDGTSTRDIAAAAGVAEALVFRHFATKRELLRAVIHEYGPKAELQRMAPRLARLPVEEALVRIYTQRIEALWRNRQFVQLCMSESRKASEASEEFRSMLEEAPRLVADFLQARIRAGQLRPFDTDVGAAVLGGAVFSFFMRHHRMPPEEGLPLCRKFAADAIGLFLRGTLPQPDAAPAPLQAARRGDDRRSGET